jgi:hypothetical protein
MPTITNTMRRKYTPGYASSLIRCTSATRITTHTARQALDEHDTYLRERSARLLLVIHLVARKTGLFARVRDVVVKR